MKKSIIFLLIALSIMSCKKAEISQETSYTMQELTAVALKSDIEKYGEPDFIQNGSFVNKNYTSYTINFIWNKNEIYQDIEFSSKDNKNWVFKEKFISIDGKSTCTFANGTIITNELKNSNK